MTTITQSITALPTAPDPATMTPAAFSTAAAAWVLAVKAMTPELNTWAGQANTVAGEVSTNATNAAASASTSSAGSAAALAAANFKGTYASRVGAAAVPYSVSHLGHFWMLLSNLADVTAKVPGTDAEWQVIGARPWIRKTSAYTAIAGDRIKASTSGGAWSNTAPASPANGDEWEILDIDGTFDLYNLTLLGNGSPKIMGYTNYVLSTKALHVIFVYDATLDDWRY